MRTRSNISALPAIVVILIVLAVLYYSFGDRYRDIPADINSAGEYTEDAATTTRIKAALVLNKQVSALDIHVETNRNNVILTGRVPSENDKRVAGEVVQGTKGVAAVTNNLQVDPNVQASSVAR